MNGTCIICKKEGGIHKHHLNYAQNVTVPVCYSCHRKIHDGEKLSAWKPTDMPNSNFWAVRRKGESKESFLIRILNRISKWGTNRALRLSKGKGNHLSPGSGGEPGLISQEAKA